MTGKSMIAMALFLTVSLSGLVLSLSHSEIPSAAAQSSISHSERPVIDQLNQQFRQHYSERELEPARLANSLTVARRLSLGLMGTIPSLEDVRTLESLPEEERIAWWLEQVLQDRRSADYLAERFARSFVGTEDGPFLVYRRRRFVTWLSDQLHANQPYDQIVCSLISDTGLWTDSPAVNFITVTNDVNDDDQPDAERLAARTTRAFLGVRLDCVQCHDDNLDGKWVQQDFHQLAAFFCEAESSLLGIRDKENAEYRYKYLHATDEQLVEPAVPFGADLLDQVRQSQPGNRRQLLAKWVTHQDNQPFARLMVNRIWALLFGRPLVEPIDSVPLNGPFPPGLELLAADFAQHGYDVRRLIRVIALSDVFQRDSQADNASELMEEQWALFPLSRLRPEQVSGSVVQASSLKTIDAESHILVKLIRAGEKNEFIKRYGDAGEDEYTNRPGTIPQRLLMMNGKLVQERTKDDLLFNASTRIARLSKNNQTCVEAAFLTTLTRRPSADELAYFMNRLETSDQSRSQVLEDLFWVLLNSTEFSWNH
ncbi:MAG: DUF1553 domain-containing protein [Planctomycetales bacterium]|nr:DUF1553 domain-containing protein [Planctomycetales bacterium]